MSAPAPPAPEIAVVVPSHDRPLRLRWLLNALEEQTLERARFEVVVAHDSGGPDTARLLSSHPLAGSGVLRAVAFAPGAGSPARQRNAGWRAARAPLVAFTDDDCRPPPQWLERLLDAAAQHPGTIVQGATRPDPDEAPLLQAAAHARSVEVDPPVVWAQTCNILYPRAVLERLGGFDESMPIAGDDTELALRAIESGVPYRGAPRALTYHCVTTPGLVEAVRGVARWEHAVYVARRHPGLRRHLPGRIFWKPTHAALPGLLAGAALAWRRPLLAGALALPWAVVALPSYGGGARGRLRACAELPGRAVVDVAELVAMVRGSIRYRTLVL